VARELIGKALAHFAISGSTLSQFVGRWHRAHVHDVSASMAITASVSGS
jgi:hypothetical protein